MSKESEALQHDPPRQHEAAMRGCLLDGAPEYLRTADKGELPCRVAQAGKRLINEVVRVERNEIPFRTVRHN